MGIKTPDWVKNAVFYQIFPDRFAKGESRLQERWQTSRYEAWDSPPTLQGYKGGNLWGIIDKLDYLKDLGINAIYFTPIFQSACNHRYHTHDYYQIDPMLGGNAAFEALIEAAHQKDLKVVLDGVFNHTGRGFFFFNDILENGPHSPWLKWFTIHAWPLSAYDGSKPANYYSWVDNRALPKFNHDNPEVKEYIMQIAEYWLHKGIDGWRLDVPNEVTTPGFWQEFRDRVKAVNPEAYIVGEIWDDASEWLDGTQFDGVMNYRFAEPTVAFAAGDRYMPEYSQEHLIPYPPLSATEYATRIEALLKLYDWEIQLTQLNLLNSHDTCRLLTAVGEDQSSFILSTLLLMTFPGAPSIYYGDEVGLPGGKDPDSRRVFPEPDQWNLEIMENYQQLIALRHQYSCLRTGTYETLYADKFVYVFARILDNEEIIVAVNTDTSDVTVSFPVTKLQFQPDRLLYGKGKVVWQSVAQTPQLEITLDARNSLIAI